MASITYSVQQAQTPAILAAVAPMQNPLNGPPIAEPLSVLPVAHTPDGAESTETPRWSILTPSAKLPDR
ncbi:hypothetical protein FRC09_008988 [Ceratobasidium sp. 395]|nr:hypothetical protein FRC09_008988 [Ceratobasidium sp. 395]